MCACLQLEAGSGTKITDTDQLLAGASVDFQPGAAAATADCGWGGLGLIFGEAKGERFVFCLLKVSRLTSPGKTTKYVANNQPMDKVYDSMMEPRRSPWSILSSHTQALEDTSRLRVGKGS